MIRAFVLLNVEPGSEENVLQALKTVSGVEEAYVSYGTYDLVIRVGAETAEDLKEVTHSVRSTDQVKSTLTLMLI